MMAELYNLSLAFFPCNFPALSSGLFDEPIKSTEEDGANGIAEGGMDGWTEEVEWEVD